MDYIPYRMKLAIGSFPAPPLLLTARPQLECTEAPTREFNLAILPLLAWCGALVVAAEQQHDPFAVCMAEDAKQHPATAAGTTRADLTAYDGRIVSDPELEHAAAQLLAVLSTAHVKPEVRKHHLNRGDGSRALRAAE